MLILILGAAGNLGGQLKLSFQDKEVVSWDRADFDFLDFTELNKRLGDIHPDIVINSAAYNAVDKCEVEESEAALAWSLNRDLPANLADYCLSVNIPLVHYSTDYVFGASGLVAGAYNETDKPNPVNLYGQTKYAGEQEIARRALKGLKYYLIRTSKLFGPRGDNPQAKPSFFDLMLDLASKNDELKVVDGEVSCFTYTRDLAEATLSLIEESAPRGIYHLTNSGQATWYQGVKYLFEQAHINTNLVAIKPEAWPRPAKRPDFSALANNRRPLMRTWQAALTEYLIDTNVKQKPST